MKYIDSEKLIAEIRCIVEEETPISKGSDYYHGVADTADKLLSLITSLQQEQPLPDSTKLIEFWNEDKEMLKEKDFRDDAWRLAYNAFMCGFVRGVSVKKQERTEVDLEIAKKVVIELHPVMEYCTSMELGMGAMIELVMHGYKLGFNARKEK